MSAHHTINYIEFGAQDLAQMKAFYGSVFGWTFQDWGPTYVSFHGAGIDGGFDAADSVDCADTTASSEMSEKTCRKALVVIQSDDLKATYEAVKAQGAAIVVEPFDFPGGRRFHFADPSGNELAVWTQMALES